MTSKLHRNLNRAHDIHRKLSLISAELGPDFPLHEGIKLVSNLIHKLEHGDPIMRHKRLTEKYPDVPEGLLTRVIYALYHGETVSQSDKADMAEYMADNPGLREDLEELQ